MKNEKIEKWNVLNVSIEQLNLNLVFSCGQTFRWYKNNQEERWEGVIDQAVVYFIQRDENKIEYFSPNDPSMNDSKLVDFFNLHVPLDQLIQRWSNDDDFFKENVKGKSGLRVLKQDPVETIFAFICSSNNNIGRISKMVSCLAVNFGTLLWESQDDDKKKYYAFPTIKQLYEEGEELEEKLRVFGFGYRAKFIVKSARFLYKNMCREDLISLRGGKYEDALNILLKLSGVGRKVADCICLSSLCMHNVIPIDTHVFQISKKNYKFCLEGRILTKKTYSTIADKFSSFFGEYAGWAQLILFAAKIKA